MGIRLSDMIEDEIAKIQKALEKVKVDESYPWGIAKAGFEIQCLTGKIEALESLKKKLRRHKLIT